MPIEELDNLELNKDELGQNYSTEEDAPEVPVIEEVEDTSEDTTKVDDIKAPVDAKIYKWNGIKGDELKQSHANLHSTMLNPTLITRAEEAGVETEDYLFDLFKDDFNGDKGNFKIALKNVEKETNLTLEHTTNVANDAYLEDFFGRPISPTEGGKGAVKYKEDNGAYSMSKDGEWQPITERTFNLGKRNSQYDSKSGEYIRGNKEVVAPESNEPVLPSIKDKKNIPTNGVTREAFATGIVYAENSGKFDYTAINSESSATGAYQFLYERKEVKEYLNKNHSITSREGFKNSKEAQDGLLDYMLEDKPGRYPFMAKSLQKDYKEFIPESIGYNQLLGLEHFAGHGELRELFARVREKEITKEEVFDFVPKGQEVSNLSIGEYLKRFNKGFDSIGNNDVSENLEVPVRDGVRDNEDGTESTHLMKAEVVDGKWYGFPSLFQNKDGSWIDMSKNKDWMPAYKEAKKRGELMEFGNDKEAAIKFGEGSWKSKKETSFFNNPIIAISDGINSQVPINGEEANEGAIVDSREVYEQSLITSSDISPLLDGNMPDGVDFTGDLDDVWNNMNLSAIGLIESNLEEKLNDPNVLDDERAIIESSFSDVSDIEEVAEMTVNNKKLNLYTAAADGLFGDILSVYESDIEEERKANQEKLEQSNKRIKSSGVNMMMPGATTSREAATEIGTPDIIQFTAEEFLKKDRFNNIPPAMKLIMAERIQSLYNDKLREPEFNQKKEEMLTFWGASSKESITTEVQNFINTSSENGVAMKDIITKANELYPVDLKLDDNGKLNLDFKDEKLYNEIDGAATAHANELIPGQTNIDSSLEMVLKGSWNETIPGYLQWALTGRKPFSIIGRTPTETEAFLQGMGGFMLDISMPIPGLAAGWAATKVGTKLLTRHMAKWQTRLALKYGDEAAKTTINLLAKRQAAKIAAPIASGATLGTWKFNHEVLNQRVNKSGWGTNDIDYWDSVQEGGIDAVLGASIYGLSTKVMGRYKLMDEAMALKGRSPLSRGLLKYGVAHPTDLAVQTAVFVGGGAVLHGEAPTLEEGKETALFLLSMKFAHGVQNGLFTYVKTGKFKKGEGMPANFSEIERDIINAKFNLTKPNENATVSEKVEWDNNTSKEIASNKEIFNELLHDKTVPLTLRSKILMREFGLKLGVNGDTEEDKFKRNKRAKGLVTTEVKTIFNGSNFDVIKLNENGDVLDVARFKNSTDANTFAQTTVKNISDNIARFNVNNEISLDNKVDIVNYLKNELNSSLGEVTEILNTTTPTERTHNQNILIEAFKSKVQEVSGLNQLKIKEEATESLKSKGEEVTESAVENEILKLRELKSKQDEVILKARVKKEDEQEIDGKQKADNQLLRNIEIALSKDGDKPIYATEESIAAINKENLTENQKEALVDIDKSIKAFKSLGLDVYIHTNNAEYMKSSGEAIEGVNIQGHRNTKTGDIHMNMSHLDKLTTPHEVGHHFGEILKKANPEKYKVIEEGVYKLINENPEFAEVLDYVKSKDAKGNDIYKDVSEKKNEAFAEFIAKLQKGEYTVETQNEFINGAKVKLNKIMETLGIDYKFETNNEVLTFLDGITKKIDKGENITDADLGVAKKKAEFSELISKTKNENPDVYWSVEEVSIEDVKKGTLIETEGGQAIVKADGDIVGLFKTPGTTEKGVAGKLLSKAVEAGGTKLDNFDNYLSKIYRESGFRVVSRMKFNEEHAPEGWNKEKHGTPDVVAMVYDPAKKLTIEEKSFTNYDKAMDYRNSYVETPSAQVKNQPRVSEERGRVFTEIDNIISKTKKRLTEDVNPETLEKNAVSYLQKSKWYEEATDKEREAAVIDVRSKLAITEKKSPSANVAIKRFDKLPKEKKVTLSEKVLLKEVLKSEAKGAKGAEGYIKEINNKLIDYIKESDLNDSSIGKSLLKKVASVTNEKQFDNVVDALEVAVERQTRRDLIGNVRVLKEKVRKKLKKGDYTNQSDIIKDLLDTPSHKIKDNAVLGELVVKLEELNRSNVALVEPKKIEELNKSISELVAKSEKSIPTQGSLGDLSTDIKDRLKKELKSESTEEIDTVKKLRSDILRFERNLEELNIEGKLAEGQYEQYTKELNDFVTKFKGKSTEFNKERFETAKDVLKGLDTSKLKGDNKRVIDELVDNVINEEIFIDDMSYADNLYITALDLSFEVGKNNEPYIPTQVIAKLNRKAFAAKHSKEISDGIANGVEKLGLSDLSSKEIENILGRQNLAFIDDAVGTGKKSPIYKAIVNPIERGISSLLTDVGSAMSTFNTALGRKVNERPSFSKEAKKNKINTKVGMLMIQLQENSAYGKRDVWGYILGTKNRKDVYKNKETPVIIQEIYDALPKKRNDEGVFVVDVEKAYKGLSAREKRVFDASRKILNELESKQKHINEYRGIPFNAIENYVPLLGKSETSKADGDGYTLSEMKDKPWAANMANSNVKMASDRGKSRTSNNIRIYEPNIERILTDAVQQVNRDYHLTDAFGKMGETINNVKNNWGKEKVDGLNKFADAVQNRMIDAAKFQFESTPGTIAQKFMGATYAYKLGRLVRVPIEMGTEVYRVNLAVGNKYSPGIIIRSGLDRMNKNLINSKNKLYSFLRSETKLEDLSSGIKYEKEYTVFDELLQQTNSPYLHKFNRWQIEGGYDMNNVMANKGVIAGMAQYALGMPDRMTIHMAWMPRFMAEFKEITGEKFSYEKYSEDASYKKNNHKAILEAASVGDRTAQMYKNTSMKGQQRTKLRTFNPLELLQKNPKSGLNYYVDANSWAAPYLTYMSTFGALESAMFSKSISDAYNGINANKGDAIRAGVSIFSAGVGYGLMTQIEYLSGALTYAQQVYGDDSEEAKAKSDELAKVMTWEGLGTQILSNAVFLNTTKYTQTARVTALSLAGIFTSMSDSDEVKEFANKMTNKILMGDPMLAEKYGDKTQILKDLVPNIAFALEVIADNVGNINDFGEFYDAELDSDKKRVELWKLVESVNDLQKLYFMMKFGTQIFGQKYVDQYIRKEQEILLLRAIGDYNDL